MPGCTLYIALAMGKDTLVWVLDENCLDTARDIVRMRPRGFLHLRLASLSRGTAAWTYWRNPAHDRVKSGKPRRRTTKRRNRRSP